MSAIELQRTLIECLIYNNVCVIFRNVGHHFYQLFHNTVLIKVIAEIWEPSKKREQTDYHTGCKQTDIYNLFWR